MTCVIVFIAFTTLQMHTVLDEIVFGDQVLETSSTEVIKAVEDISKYYYYYFPSLCLSTEVFICSVENKQINLRGLCRLEAASNAISLVPKSVSGWRGR